MKIEAGKYYHSRNGHTFGPMEAIEPTWASPYTFVCMDLATKTRHLFMADVRFEYDSTTPYDLVEVLNA